MTINRRLIVAVMAVAVATAGCASESDYDETWTAFDIATGKADGLFDNAPLLSLGVVTKGSLAPRQLSVYALDLREGDKVTLVQNVTVGTLSPHFTLYSGLSAVRSSSFQAAPKKLTKKYTAASTGRYYVGVSPYQGQGSGEFSLVATCNGGPCAGQVVVRELTAEERGLCIKDAFAKSRVALPSFGGVMGQAKARALLNKSLKESAALPVSCQNACEGDNEAKALCDAIVADLPFFADQSAACVAELDTCLSDCGDESRDLDDSFGSTEIAVCYYAGFNGDCRSYARQTVECGGTLAADTEARCLAYCESTTGAWLDDLDLICKEACE